MKELESKYAFELAEKYTRSKSTHINSYWLKSNGYVKIRRQIDKVRKTYYIKY
jgi:hypothetical protein